MLKCTYRINESLRPCFHFYTTTPLSDGTELLFKFAACSRLKFCISYSVFVKVKVNCKYLDGNAVYKFELTRQLRKRGRPILGQSLLRISLRLNFWALSRSGVGWAGGGGAAKWRRTGEREQAGQAACSRDLGNAHSWHRRAEAGEGRDHRHLVLFAPSELASSAKWFPLLPDTRVLMLLWPRDK